ncbi:MAG: DPP IV N-terminal domain-containing protein [Anaerolineae bacterium]
MISSRVPNTNSAERNHNSRPKWGVTPHLHRWQRLTVALLFLCVLLVNPIAQAEMSSDPVLHLTYLPLVARFYRPIRRIAFASTRESGRQIWVIDDAGTNLQRLTTLGGWNDGPAWSPDGSKIAFSSGHADHADRTDDIYVMNSDGTGVISLTNNPNFADREPSWSPDGQRIVFTRVFTDGQNSVLIIMNANGCNTIQLTNGWDSQPDWSPDGSMIAFTRNNDIYIISITGTNLVNLTSGWSSNESQPTWSPDGKKIAFVSNKGDAFIGNIWMVNADGSGGFTQLTFGSTDADHPSFSPDGGSIVFSRVITTASINTNLWIARIDLSGENRLTQVDAVDASPDW